MICPSKESIDEWWNHLSSPFKRSHFKPVGLQFMKHDYSSVRSYEINFDDSLVTKEYSADYKSYLLFSNNYSKYIQYVKAFTGLSFNKQTINNIKVSVKTDIINNEHQWMKKKSLFDQLKVFNILKKNISFRIGIETTNIIQNWHDKNFNFFFKYF
ncbi:unnamed protein product [Didymodactylos carnosus]|uniref:Uncharacterized protein n=1 Tax=Didymodactylos carnosus TaxID=1234261 RepID=A0A814QTZ6_9BILA|nr:unnamed protein product [Didymodactylos carnosus]CAF3887140.1 unnamed protein product [Didymodactylos carnosus]